MSQQHAMMYVIISMHEFSGNCTQGFSLLAVHYLFLIEVLHSENLSGLKQQHRQNSMRKQKEQLLCRAGNNVILPRLCHIFTF